LQATTFSEFYVQQIEDFMITAEQLLKLSPSLTHADVWAKEFNASMTRFGINTPARRQMFMATVMHESSGLTRLQENLNYSAEGLVKVFGKYFGKDSGRNSALYHRKPQMIANVVYANRMGNGSTLSGDGWKYRGRGPIMATGKDMYEAAGKACFNSPSLLLVNPDLLLVPAYGAAVACWIWQSKGCNELADADRFEAVTKKINGGLIGLEDRYKWLHKCEKIIT
jgi:putative chitinase